MEPERVMVRRGLPFGIAATLIAVAVAWFAGGPNVAVSTAIGGTVVLVNFLANGYSLAWGARTSPTFFGLVAGLGFFVRMAIIFGAMALLVHTSFFSPAAFILAAVPIMLVMLVFEAKMVMGPMGREIRIPDAGVNA